MNNLKKIGLTALAASLVSTSVFAGAMNVTGSAGITFAGQDSVTSANGWTMSDEITFSGGGEMDNGWTVDVSMQLDNNAQGSSATTQNLDNRSIVIGMGDMGTVSFIGHGGDSALGAVDDTTPNADGNESWDTISAAGETAAKFGSIGGNSVENMFKYSTSAIVEGLSLNVTYAPQEAANITGTTSMAIAYTGIDGLTLGYAIDENSEAGALQTDYSTMYAKYVYGAVTVGVTTSEEDSATAADNDEFQAYGISYAVTENLSVAYNEATYDAATVALDQESTAVDVSYTMGSMTLTGTMVSMENVAGSSASAGDVDGYELNLSFAF